MSNPNDINQRLENGDFKPLQENDTFKFSCNQCGVCCMDRNDIVLSPYDVFNIAKHLNIASHEVINKYCASLLGADSKIPIIIADFQRQNGIEGKFGVCPFLGVDRSNGTPKFLCSIHEVKPFVCASYPLGRLTRMTKDNKTEIQYFDQKIKCDTCDLPQIEYKLKDWMEMYNLKESERASSDFSNFLISILQKFDFVKFYNNKTITQRTKELFYNSFISCLYADLNTNKNVYEVLNDRYTQFNIEIDGLLNAMKLSGIEI